MTRRLFLAAFALLPMACSGPRVGAAPAPFRAGAFAIDITPERFPVIVNGSRLERRADQAHDRLHARWLVLDDGPTTVALCVVDTCLIPREFADRVKADCERAAGIPAGHLLISATHTHSAPSLMGALGSDPDSDYPGFLAEKLVKGLIRAKENLAPARVGWNVVRDPEHTHCRQWIRRPDRMQRDPFGELTVRSNMGPGHESPDTIGPSGPADPELSVLAIQSLLGRPLALLANYSMHYKGAEPLSADYFGKFCGEIEATLAAPGGPPFVAILSQGTSGDLMWPDFSRPRNDPGLDAYGKAVARVALEAYGRIEYRDGGPLAVREKSLRLRRRVPDADRLAWARKVVDGMQGRKPASTQEAYAREQIFLHEEPERDVKLQAIRVGELGIAAIPCEVFGLTGLKIKALSPLVPTFTIGLANGEEGYIPPPEQHQLGGYTTWPARTAGLEVQAEPRIVEAVLGLLEEVAGKRRRTPEERHGAYARAVLASRPSTYWRFSEFGGPNARDSSGQGKSATYGDGIVFYLDGPPFPDEPWTNRAVHLAGGRVVGEIRNPGAAGSVEFWFWNGFPQDARGVTGYLLAWRGDTLAIGGSDAPEARGKLLLSREAAPAERRAGRTNLRRRTWYHVVVAWDGESRSVYLNGRAELAVETGERFPSGGGMIFIGGRSDGFAPLEGKIDEAAVYDRALSPAEAAVHYAAAGLPAD